MSEPARLQVLKDVAGTDVYEKKREESVKIINDTGEYCHPDTKYVVAHHWLLKMRSGRRSSNC